MQRYAMVCRVRPGKREEYLALHREVWPGVEAMITQCGIRNFSIYVIEDILFGYYEYIGDDFDADQQRMAGDPLTQEWWARTAPCQVPLTADADVPNWQPLEEAWHLD
ncbi:L-rhamnose mutarotase [Microbacterium sp. DT81.1]|uniref:L-rhamnose mutarotase n=1 Tax=Microbacterium sp. DT81.1 TaxID=3393413 RepID=UPI003CEFB5CB